MILSLSALGAVGLGVLYLTLKSKSSHKELLF